MGPLSEQLFSFYPKTESSLEDNLAPCREWVGTLAVHFAAAGRDVGSQEYKGYVWGRGGKVMPLIFIWSFAVPCHLHMSNHWPATDLTQ